MRRRVCLALGESVDLGAKVSNLLLERANCAKHLVGLPLEDSAHRAGVKSGLPALKLARVNLPHPVQVHVGVLRLLADLQDPGRRLADAVGKEAKYAYVDLD